MAKKSPTTNQIRNWLDKAQVEYSLCEHCDGLHLSGIQAIAGVMDCRLFLEDWGLLLSTELLVRPSTLLPLSAYLSPLNASYPTLKLFLEVVDDSLPQLVASASLLTGAGLTEGQFALFLSTLQDTVTSLASELREMEFLSQDEMELAPAGQLFH